MIDAQSCLWNVCRQLWCVVDRLYQLVTDKPRPKGHHHVNHFKFLDPKCISGMANVLLQCSMPNVSLGMTNFTITGMVRTTMRVF